MDTLKGIVEHVESQPGEAIVSRDESLVLLASQPGLGPPDLCWLHKASKGAFGTSTGEPRGYYHHILGRDVSSSAAIAAYFAEISSLVEPMSFLQGLWYTSETKIDRGLYCCYDPFTRMDIRCELCIPGGVVCGALDPEGKVHDVTPELWKHCQLASFLRAELCDADLASHADNLKRYNPVLNQESEKRLLALVEDLYLNKVLPEALDLLDVDVGRGCTAEHMDIVLFTLFHYFGRRQRWAAAIEFFGGLAEVYIPAAVYVGAAQRELDDFETSFATLSQAVERDPFNPQLLVALANECMYADQLDLAAKLVRRTIRIKGTLRPAWLLLSRCYSRQGLFGLSLITLNVVPTPPMPTQERDPLFTVAPPSPKGKTKPTVSSYDADVASVKQLAEEEVSVDGSRVLLYLPGAVLVNREPLDLGPWADVAPYRMTRAALMSAYGLLQELVSAIGWDAFLELRSNIFVMHSNVGKKSPQSTSMEPDAMDSMLEEMAAMGMMEYPEEVEEVRRQQAAKAASGPQAPSAAASIMAARTKAELERPDEAKPGTGLPMAGPPQPSSSNPGALLGATASQGRSQGGAGASEVIDLSSVLSEQPANGTAHGSAPSAMTSLWNAVFGTDRGRAGRPDMTESMAGRIQHNLININSMPSRPLDVMMPRPVAEAREHCCLPHPSTSPMPLSMTSNYTCSSSSNHSTSKQAQPLPTTSSTTGSNNTKGPRSVPRSLPKVLRKLQVLLQKGAGTAQHGGAISINTSTSANAYSSNRQPSALPPAGPCPQQGFSAFRISQAQPDELCSADLANALIMSSFLASLATAGAGGSATIASASGTTTTSAATASTQPGTPFLPCSLQAAGSSHSHVNSDASDWWEPAGSAVSSLHALPTPQHRQQHCYNHHSHHNHSTAVQAVAVAEANDRRATGSTDGGVDLDARLGPAMLQSQPMTGDVLKAFEHDKECAILGRVQEESDVKRLCVRWLDELIIALWHDLQAYMEWKSQDDELLRSHGNTLAGLVLGLPPVQLVASATQSDKPAGTVALPAGDWMRRGLLAERLFHDSEALSAYRCCVKMGFNLLAYHGIMRLGAHAGEYKLALQAVNSVLTWHEQHGIKGSQGNTAAAPSTPARGSQLARCWCPLAVVCCVSHLLARLGQEGVAALQSELGGELHPQVKLVLDQAATLAP